MSAATVITRDFQIINLFEGGFWIVCGIVAAVLALQHRGRIRRDLIILAVALFVFGTSDILEARTGAWWKPAWLLAIKAACVLVFLLLLAAYVRRRLR